MQTYRFDTPASQKAVSGLGFNLGVGATGRQGLAGLGLGLPSTADRRASTSSGSLCFPLPSSSRKASMASEVLNVEGLVSYWSPLTDEGDEFEYQGSDIDEEEEVEADYTEDRLAWVQPHLSPFELASSPAASTAPLQEQPFAPHACLHLLSPKLDSFTKAAAAQGIADEDALSTALEWAWIVPMVGKSKRCIQG